MSKVKRQTSPPLAENIILGIDPGYATTGFAFITNDLEILEYGVIKTPAKDAFSKRLHDIHCDLCELIQKHKPHKAGVEKIFFAKNAKTAIDVGQARGVMLLTLMQHGITLEEFTPLQVKQAICGYGRADKKQVQEMVQRIFQLEEPPKPDDAADALAIAYIVSNSKITN